MVVDQELPCNRETEEVEAVVVDKVLHLADTVSTAVLRERRSRLGKIASLLYRASSKRPNVLVGNKARTPSVPQPKSNPAMSIPANLSLLDGVEVGEEPPDEELLVGVEDGVELAVPGRH